jgi:quinol monooxygenase YgiN
MRRSNNPFGAYRAGSGLDTRFVAFLPVASKKSWRSEGNMLTVVARYVVSEGHDSTVARLLRKNAEASRNEPGCLEFSVYQEIDDPRAFLLYERYTSEDAFQAHRRTPHFENIIELQVVPLLDERVWARMEPLPNGPG